MEKYNKLLKNVTELLEKGLINSKDMRNELENLVKFKMEIMKYIFFNVRCFK